ncbi:MAG: cupin domain-containing protein [Rhodospirillum sp.]|nr:cupin domain-containing protein [Rhodospirillum sp.]MCF8489804.1 cupin domain-containing protein [Rhodospirillum sp.]MCF8501609.1 cupin domain-containing protein [Rhodospirillum sp.]
MGRLTEDLAPPGPEEAFSTLWAAQGARVERIVSHGHATPGEAWSKESWYDQEWDEWVMVVQGAAHLRLEEELEDRVLGPGNWIVLPAGCRHRVVWTDPDGPTIWLAVHFPRTPV